MDFFYSSLLETFFKYQQTCYFASWSNNYDFNVLRASNEILINYKWNSLHNEKIWFVLFVSLEQVSFLIFNCGKKKITQNLSS